MTFANGYKRSKRVHRRHNSVPPVYVLKPALVLKADRCHSGAFAFTSGFLISSVQWPSLGWFGLRTSAKVSEMSGLRKSVEV